MLLLVGGCCDRCCWLLWLLLLLVVVGGGCCWLVVVVVVVVGCCCCCCYAVFVDNSAATFLRDWSRPLCCRASTTATPSSSASRRRHWHHCRVLHAAPRLVLDLEPRDHVTPALRELHWLPVVQRIEYKLCLLVHRALIGQAPDYITNLLTLVTNTPSLRASSNGDLFQPRTDRRIGDRAFSVAAPRLPTELTHAVVDSNIQAPS